MWISHHSHADGGQRPLSEMNSTQSSGTLWKTLTKDSFCRSSPGLTGSSFFTAITVANVHMCCLWVASHPFTSSFSSATAPHSSSLTACCLQDQTDQRCRERVHRHVCAEPAAAPVGVSGQGVRHHGGGPRLQARLQTGRSLPDQWVTTLGTFK